MSPETTLVTGNMNILTSWRCQACNQVVKEDQEHLTLCEGYQKLRADAELGNEQQLVEFFNRVMAKRKEMKWD